MRRCGNSKYLSRNKNFIRRDCAGAKNAMRYGKSIVVTEEERPESLRRGGERAEIKPFMLITAESLQKEKS